MLFWIIFLCMKVVISGADVVKNELLNNKALVTWRPMKLNDVATRPQGLCAKLPPSSLGQGRKLLIVIYQRTLWINLTHSFSDNCK